MYAESMLGGILSTIRKIVDLLTNLPNLLVTGISYLFSAFLYAIQIGLFWIIDMVQMVFRRIAGLDAYWYRSGGTYTEQTGDIVESMITSDIVWQVFVSVLIAAIILLFVTTMIAILKTEVNEKDNAKGPVIKQALKAVAYFVIVPVVCVFGVTLANIFLRTFDSATSLKGATSISGQVFAAAAYSSNRVRNGHDLTGDYTNDTWGRWALTKQRLSYVTVTETRLKYVEETDENGNIVYEYETDEYGEILYEADGVTPKYKTDSNGNKVPHMVPARYTEDTETHKAGDFIYEEVNVASINKNSSQDAIADFIDNCFVRDASFGGRAYNVSNLSLTDPTLYTYSLSNYMGGYAYFVHGDNMTEHFSHFDKTNTGLVYIYYDLLSYNYLIGYLASFTIIMLLLNLLIGVIQRMFDLTILFIVSPAFVATMPIDNGSRYGKWRDEFVKKTLGCYGPILGINLAFTVLTLVQQIYIFDPAGGGLNGLFNSLMQCLFVITAILCVKDFGILLNGIIGGEDITKNKAADVNNLIQRGAAAGMTGLSMGAHFATDSLKVRDKKKKADASKKELDDFDSADKVSARKREFLTKQAEERLRQQKAEDLAAHSATYRGLSEEGKKAYLDKKMEEEKNADPTAYARKLTAEKRNVLREGDFLNKFNAADAVERQKVVDKYEHDKMDERSARGARYMKFKGGYDNLKKAGNRSKYLKAWEDSGGDDAVKNLREAKWEMQDRAQAWAGIPKEERIRSLFKMQDDLETWKKQKDLNRDRANTAKGDKFDQLDNPNRSLL